MRTYVLKQTVIIPQNEKKKRKKRKVLSSKHAQVKLDIVL